MYRILMAGERESGKVQRFFLATFTALMQLHGRTRKSNNAPTFYFNAHAQCVQLIVLWN